MLILASKSPRRKELVSILNVPFTIHAAEIDETYKEGEKPELYAQRMADKKAQTIAEREGTDNPILSADSIVVLNEKLLGKPRDKEDAKNMLTMLSDNIHQVITAYTILTKSKTFKKNIITDVSFKKLTSEEIDEYIKTKEPYDKAGSYAIQGCGSYMVKSINGSYTNVVGLPLYEVYEDLKECGII